MSDQEKSAWEKVLDEISSPWDWVALAVGAAGGAGVTVFTHGTELGTSMATGALIAIAARKAGYASLQRRRLRNRASGLHDVLEENSRQQEDSDIAALVKRLGRERQLWERKAISDEEFSRQLDELVTDFRQQLEIHKSGSKNSAEAIPPIDVTTLL